ncbi:MAG: PaRep2a protein [Pyrobaculum sp.]
MNWEVKKEVLAALENWLLSCFYAAPFWKEEYRRRVVQRFEEYVVMCEVARYLRREYKMLVFESDVEGGFWWDGEFMGKPTSCFITYSKAICDWGGRRIYVVESTWWNTDAEDICKDALQTSTRRKHVVEQRDGTPNPLQT